MSNELAKLIKNNKVKQEIKGTALIKQMIEDGKLTLEDVKEVAKLGYSKIEDGVLIKFDKRDLDKNGNYTVPAGVKVIDSYAFSGVKANTINLGSVTHIREHGFWNNWIQHIVLPNTIKSMEDSAFHLSWEITSIDLPNNLEEIPVCAFDNCLKLKTVKLPTNLKEIGECAFARCESLENIKLPKGIERIRSGAFARCEQLKTINKPGSLVWIGRNVFLGTQVTSKEGYIKY